MLKKEEGLIPKEYLKGYTYFLGCKINLSKKVFIPREETAFWVKECLKEIQRKAEKNRDYPIKVLDIFAGSGCIGIAVLKKIKKAIVDFVDIEKNAISAIKINLKINKISKKKFKVIKSNLFEKLDKKKYDFILANPPYVAEKRIKEVQPSVLKWEPTKAIFGGEKGLFYIENFLENAKNHLEKKGIVYMEFDPLQKKEIEGILKKNFYQNFKFMKDQFQKYRWLKIYN